MARPHRILIIEDSVSYAELLKDMLTEGQDGLYAADCAGSLAMGLLRLGESPFDLVMLDLHLPDAEGPAACQAVAMTASSIPIVVVSGSTDIDGMATECLQKGAQDYLVKGEFDRRYLLHSVHYAMQRKKIETDFKVTQEALLRANKELVEKVRELDRLNAIMMGREERILEMKEEIRVLKDQLLKSFRSAAA